MFTAGFVDAAEVPHVAVHADGTRTDIAPAAETRELAPVDPPPLPEPLPAGPTRRAPLGMIAGARSGDKGGSANVGVWVRTDEQWRWLAHTLTVDKLRELLPETADLPVTRHLLPNLRAVNFVIDGILGQGVAYQARFDPQAKGLGEWLRSRHVDIPKACCDHLAHPRTRAATKDRARVRRTRDPAARARVGAHGELPRELHRKAGDAGLLGAGLPEAVGGGGGDGADSVIICEEMHYAGSPGGVFASLFTSGIAVPHMIASGDERLIDTFVRPTLRGDKIGSLAITEPGGGSDVGHLTTRATRDGDDYIVNGAKTYITSGVRADYVVTAARTGGPGAAGVSLIVVDKGTPGFEVTRKLDKMGWRSSDTAELSYTDVRVPAANLIGAENTGFAQIAAAFVSERVGLAAQAYASAQRCLDLTARVVPGPRNLRQATDLPPVGAEHAGRDGPAHRRRPGVHAPPGGAAARFRSRRAGDIR